MYKKNKTWMYVQGKWILMYVQENWILTYIQENWILMYVRGKLGYGGLIEII